jgi:hypothetical protein
MTPCKFITAVFCLVLPASSFCQERTDFKYILASKKIGKVYKKGSIEDTTWRTYLGALQDNNNKDTYFVIREFFKIKAASNWHGNSIVYFFDKNMKQIASVHVAMPEDLPYKLYRNKFYFKFDENGIIKHDSTVMQLPLPKVFCSGRHGCEEIFFD